MTEAGVSVASPVPSNGSSPRLGRRRESATGHVALLHFGRAGSTVLLDLLSQSEGLLNGREPFVGYHGEYRERMRREGRFVDYPWHRSSHYPHAPLEYLRELLPTDGQRYLASLKLYHVRGVGMGFEPFIEGLEALGFSHFVVLTRRNYLRKVVSCLVAEAKEARGDTSPYFNVDGRPAECVRVRVDPASVEIDSDERPLSAFFEEWDRDFDEVRRLLRERRSLELRYEDHVEEDPSAACVTAREFLGAEQTPLVVRYGRTTPHALPEVIENYEEIAGYLADTPWAWMAPSRAR